MDDNESKIDVKLEVSGKRPVTFDLRLKVEYEKDRYERHCEVYEAFLPKLEKLIEEMSPDY